MRQTLSCIHAERSSLRGAFFFCSMGEGTAGDGGEAIAGFLTGGRVGVAGFGAGACTGVALDDAAAADASLVAVDVVCSRCNLRIRICGDFEMNLVIIRIFFDHSRGRRRLAGLSARSLRLQEKGRQIDGDGWRSSNGKCREPRASYSALDVDGLIRSSRAQQVMQVSTFLASKNTMLMICKTRV